MNLIIPKLHFHHHLDGFFHELKNYYNQSHPKIGENAKKNLF